MQYNLYFCCSVELPVFISCNAFLNLWILAWNNRCNAISVNVWESRTFQKCSSKTKRVAKYNTSVFKTKRERRHGLHVMKRYHLKRNLNHATTQQQQCARKWLKSLLQTTSYWKHDLISKTSINSTSSTVQILGSVHRKLNFPACANLITVAKTHFFR